MKNVQKDQIELYNLIFTQNWEDPNSDIKALRISQGDSIMTITSGGCNTLQFLCYDPEIIYAVDINPSQSFLLEMKIGAIKTLNYDQFIEFLGLLPSDIRIEQYQKIRNCLSEDAGHFWDHHLKIIEKGFLIRGRYENFVKYVGKLIQFIQGRKRVRGLFANENLDQQKEFYDNFWDTKRTRLIFNLFFNKHILARRGLKADYFHFDDGSTSFAESFFKKFSHAARDIPVDGNYFLHLYLMGKYRSLQEAPIYLLKEHYEIIKSRVGRIRIITDDAKKWLMSIPDFSIDCFSLSNICELMSLEDTRTLFNEVFRSSTNDGRICFRNLMIPREVPEELQDKIIKDNELSKELMELDRSFVYSKVAAYCITK